MERYEGVTMQEEEKFYVHKYSGHYYTGKRIPVSGKVLFEGTEKECYEFVKKEMDSRSVIYAIEHILLVYEKDISPNLHNKLSSWKKNIQEELDKE